MHLMSVDEAGDLARDGIDIQLHSHRHWVPEDETLIRREILENRERIEAITGRPADHFCYPSGVHYPELLDWLRKLNVRSATTCEPGLAAASDDPLMLPRFLDHSGVSQTEFEGWATGALRAFPRRQRVSHHRRGVRPPRRPGIGESASEIAALTEYEEYLQREWLLFAGTLSDRRSRAPARRAGVPAPARCRHRRRPGDDSVRGRGRDVRGCRHFARKRHLWRRAICASLFATAGLLRRCHAPRTFPSRRIRSISCCAASRFPIRTIARRLPR